MLGVSKISILVTVVVGCLVVLLNCSTEPQERTVRTSGVDNQGDESKDAAAGDKSAGKSSGQASPSPSPSASPSPAASPGASPVASPSPKPTASATPSPSPSPTVQPTVTPAAVTYTKDIEPALKTKCGGGGCHAGEISYTWAKANAKSSKFTGPHKGGPWSATESSAITKWVAGGMAN